MNISDILQIRDELKHSNRVVYLNYYNKYNGSDKEFTVYDNEGAVVFIVPEQYVDRAFFFATDLESLAKLLMQSPKGTVLDYVCKGDMPAELKRTVSVDGGYICHSVYERCFYPIPYIPPQDIIDPKVFGILQEMYDPSIGRPATMAELPHIKRILLDNFDPVNSDILPDEELISAIENGWVWIYKPDDEIYTMYIYQVFGKKRYGALTYNRLSADYLYSIEETADRLSVKRYDLKQHYYWIDVSNRKIIRRMTKIGRYIPDGIKNHIFIKEGEKK